MAYSVRDGICLVSPDPIGPIEDRRRIWREFRGFAEAQGLARGRARRVRGWLPIYEADGMASLYMGDEAVVDPTTFKIDGGKAKGLRHAVNRATTAGYTFELPRPLLPRARARGVAAPGADRVPPGRRSSAGTR